MTRFPSSLTPGGRVIFQAYAVKHTHTPYQMLIRLEVSNIQIVSQINDKHTPRGFKLELYIWQLMGCL